MMTIIMKWKSHDSNGKQKKDKYMKQKNKHKEETTSQKYKSNDQILYRSKEVSESLCILHGAITLEKKWSSELEFWYCPEGFELKGVT